MSGRGPQVFPVSGTGSLALLALGVALGYLGYPWIAPSADHPNEESGHLHEAEADQAGERDMIQIPPEIQHANGISIRRAELRSFESSIRVTGTVSADQTRVARIRPLARGVIEQVLVRLGDRVSEGDSVVRYDNIDLGLAVGEFLAANADLRSTQTNLDVNETILARSREMLAVQAVARTEHDVLEAEFRSAQAQVDSARALVAKFEEQLHRFGLTEDDLTTLSSTEDTSYHRTVSRAVLRTPSSGIVTALDAGVGDVIDPSSELLTVTDISVVWVLADVSERDLRAVRVGKPVSIRVSTYQGESFGGRIGYAGDVLEPASRTARVRCLVANADARLKIGMFATVEIPSGKSYEALAVPSEAIQEFDGEPIVFVQLSDAEFEQRHIQTGLEADGWIEVTNGLSVDDAVVVAGSSVAKTMALRALTH